MSSANRTTAFGRSATLLYGLGAYAVGMTGLFWLILTGLGLTPISGGPFAIASREAAIAFNLGMLALFGIQHAIMARPAFKARWTRVIPAAIERSTFVLITGLIVGGFLWLWQPMTETVWAVESPVLARAIRALCALGWVYMVGASFAINHFELFGLQQVWRHFRSVPDRDNRFVNRFMYRFDRHPIMTGMLVGLWATPVMRFDHLLLAGGLSAYMVIGVFIEERTLVSIHGQSYADYRRTVPALVPVPGRRAG